MKRKHLIIFLTVEAALLTALCLLVSEYPEYFKNNSFPFNLIGDYFFAVQESGNFLQGLIEVIPFPFEQIGQMLRLISSYGIAGNTVATVILTLLSSLPLIPFLKHIKDKSKNLENFILLLLCPVTAIVLYYMANYSAMFNLPHVTSEEAADVMGNVLACTLWSGILAYFTAVIIRHFTSYNKDKIIKHTQFLSYILCGIFVFIICTVCLPNYLYELSGGISTVAERISVKLSFWLSVLSYILDIAVLLSAHELTDAFIKSKSLTVLSVKASDLAKKSSWSLVIVTVGSFIKNIIQIVCIDELSNVHTTLSIPLFNFGFLFVTLLLSKLILENKRLKEDNDLFV